MAGACMSVYITSTGHYLPGEPVDVGQQLGVDITDVGGHHRPEEQTAVARRRTGGQGLLTERDPAGGGHRPGQEQLQFSYEHGVTLQATSAMARVSC